MGLRSLRATCPNCGGKIHTQPKGLGHLTWANSWVLAQTGTECQHCGVALTGKITAGGQAVLAEATAPPPAFKRPVQVLPREAGWYPDPAGRFDRRYFSGRFWTEHVTRDARQQQLVDPEPVAAPR